VTTRLFLDLPTVLRVADGTGEPPDLILSGPIPDAATLNRAVTAVTYLLHAIAPDPQPDPHPSTQPAQPPRGGADGDTAAARPARDLTGARWLSILDDQASLLALVACGRGGKPAHSPVLTVLRIALLAGCTHVTVDPVDGSIGVARRRVRTHR